MRTAGEATARRNGKAQRARLSSIKPSPENDQLYSPIDPDDPEILALAESIRKRGVLEPLVLTSDGWIVSGHRRYVAAGLADRSTVPVRRVRLRRDRDRTGFLRLLREHNRQRDKTNAEKLREELVTISPEDAHEDLIEYRRAAAAVGVKTLSVGHVRQRRNISAAKLPMLRAAQCIVESRRRFWPLSDRQVHYAILNEPPMRNTDNPESTYRNDLRSYKDLTDLLTRARLDGSIPFEAIADETRPIDIWDVHQDSRSFVQRELGNMFQGYWRDLMQSQPNHVEIVGEKNTVASILKTVAANYTISLTTGRGFCSLPPRHAMAERFRKSGKEKLVLLFASDHDPEGESIPESFARSMRDDFGVVSVHPIKMALTAEQVRRFKLPPMMKAKDTSSRYAAFVDKHGEDVFELEALPPETLQDIVRGVIESVIDREQLDQEIEAERQDAAFLEGVRRTVHEALRGIET